MGTLRPAGTLAAIDAGSNTVHMVAARPDPDGRDLAILADEIALVRLGADVTATGAIGPERTARAIVEVRRQVEIARQLGASPILGIATEGVRAARNSAEFVERVLAETGLELALISGEQEAALTFWGATSGRRLRKRTAVVDLGGGSLELVVGDAAHVAWRVSLPLGSGAIHDRLAPSDPADPGELAAAARVVEEMLAALAPPLPVGVATACGGTATTLAALAALALGSQASTDQSGVGENAQDLPELTDKLLERLIGLAQTLPAADIARRYQVDEERGRLLAAGAVVLREAMRRLETDQLHVSRRGVREGAILAYQRHGADWLAAAARG